MGGRYRDAVRFKNSTANGNFALEWQLFQYGERMLGRIETAEPLLTFLLKLLPRQDRMAALRLMRCKTPKKLLSPKSP